MFHQHALAGFFIELGETKSEIYRRNVPSLRITAAKQIAQSRTHLPCYPTWQQGGEPDQTYERTLAPVAGAKKLGLKTRFRHQQPQRACWNVRSNRPLSSSDAQPQRIQSDKSLGVTLAVGPLIVFK